MLYMATMSPELFFFCTYRCWWRWWYTICSSRNFPCCLSVCCSCSVPTVGMRIRLHTRRPPRLSIIDRIIALWSFGGKLCLLAARMLAKPLLSQVLSNLLLHKVFQLLLQGVSTSRLGDVWTAVAWRLLRQYICIPGHGVSWHRWWRITIRGIPCRWRAMRERLRRPIRVLRRRRSWKMRVAWRRWGLGGSVLSWSPGRF